MTDDSTNASRRTVLKALGAAGTLLAASGTAAAQSIQPQRFTSQATTTVEYQNPDTGETIETREYTDENVEVIITEPVTRGAQGEANPFHLEVLPGAPLLPESDEIEGSLSVFSAYDFGGSLEQFWDLQLETSNSFTGSLTTAQAPDDRPLVNYLQAWRPGQEVVRPLPLSENSTLEASLEANQLTLNITGNALDEDGNPAAPFESEITGTNP